MTDLLLGWLITSASFLLGYLLGKNNSIVPPDVKERAYKQIKQTFRRVVPDTEVGAVETLSQRDLDVLRNPKLKAEQDELERTLNKLNG